LVKSGQTSEDLIYQKIVGLKDDLSGPQNTPAILQDDDSDCSNSMSEDESVGSNERSKFFNSARPKNEDAESKKVRF